MSCTKCSGTGVVPLFTSMIPCACQGDPVVADAGSSVSSPSTSANSPEMDSLLTSWGLVDCKTDLTADRHEAWKREVDILGCGFWNVGELRAEAGLPPATWDFVISSGKPDRDGDILDPRGCTVSKEFAKWPSLKLKWIDDVAAGALTDTERRHMAEELEKTFKGYGDKPIIFSPSLLHIDPIMFNHDPVAHLISDERKKELQEAILDHYRKITPPIIFNGSKLTNLPSKSSEEGVA